MMFGFLGMDEHQNNAKKSHVNLTMAHSYINIRWVVTGTMEFGLYMTFHSVGNGKSSQLRGRSTTNQIWCIAHVEISKKSLQRLYLHGWLTDGSRIQLDRNAFETWPVDPKAHRKILDFRELTQTLELLGGSRVHQCPLPTDGFGAVSLSFQKGWWLAHKTPAVHCSGDP